MNTDEKRWQLIQTALHKKQLEQAFALFREAGIEPVLIKGWAAVRFYPEDNQRYLGDIDLCVAPEDFSLATETLKNDPGGLPVDLHNGLRHLDSVSFRELMSYSRLIRLGETDVRVLCDEDHLRVLCIHWLNDGGAYREKLKDIHYAVENRRADFNWDRCLNIVNKKRRRWTICAILLAHKYFATKIDDTPIADEKELPKWLIKAVEKEWADPVRLQPLGMFLKDRAAFWQQLKKRIPPNPIQATIEMGGDFDARYRIHYQLLDVFFRVFYALKKSRATLSSSNN